MVGVGMVDAEKRVPRFARNDKDSGRVRSVKVKGKRAGVPAPHMAEQFVLERVG